MSNEQRFADVPLVSVSSNRLTKLRLLRALATNHDSPIYPVRADVLALLCDCAIALDIYAENNEALKRLDKL